MSVSDQTSEKKKLTSFKLSATARPFVPLTSFIPSLLSEPTTAGVRYSCHILTTRSTTTAYCGSPFCFAPIDPLTFVCTSPTCSKLEAPDICCDPRDPDSVFDRRITPSACEAIPILSVDQLRIQREIASAIEKQVSLTDGR